MGENHLQDEIPHSIGGLSNLEALKLHGNEFSGEFPESVQQLQKLKWVVLVLLA